MDYRNEDTDGRERWAYGQGYVYINRHLAIGAY